MSHVSAFEPRYCSVLPILIAVFSVVGCDQSSALAPGVTVLAVSGDPAPGLGEGYLHQGFEPEYAMGASGHIAFAGSANVKNGGAQTRKQALWFGTTDELVPIALVGQSVSGRAADTSIAAFSPYAKVISRSGKLGFIARTSGAATGATALMVYVDGELETAVASGDRLPTPSGDIEIRNIFQFAMTDAGVLFSGEFGRRQTGVWFWDYSDMFLVAADGEAAEIGDKPCAIRSTVSTNLDLNQEGLAVFRVTFGGADCPSRGGVIAWDAKTKALTPVALNRTPLSEESELYYQSLTGDARVGDDGHVVLHANVYANEGAFPGAREMTLLQPKRGTGSRALFVRDGELVGDQGIAVSHAILGGGLGSVNAGYLAHFVRSNRDRIILRSSVDDVSRHEVVAHTGTQLGDQIAARIGDAQVNRNGDIVFTGFIDDGPQGGTYLQELWIAKHAGGLHRLAYPGQALNGGSEQTIDRISSANQSYEPTMASTQGGRSRQISDSGAVLFAARVRREGQWSPALLLATPD